jgi:hypothetical protein
MKTISEQILESNYLLNPHDLTVGELIKYIYNMNEAKGFWQNPSYGQKMGLIIGEMSEAIEADRKDNRASTIWNNAGFDDETLTERLFIELRRSPKDFMGPYEILVRGTIEEELADVVIRTLDLMGGFKHLTDLDTRLKDVLDCDLAFFFCNMTCYDPAPDFASDMYHCMQAYCNGNIVQALNNVLGVASDLNIDLWTHIQWKLVYNESRAHMHGKKY